MIRTAAEAASITSWAYGLLITVVVVVIIIQIRRLDLLRMHVTEHTLHLRLILCSSLTSRLLPSSSHNYVSPCEASWSSQEIFIVGLILSQITFRWKKEDSRLTWQCHVTSVCPSITESSKMTSSCVRSAHVTSSIETRSMTHWAQHVQSCFDQIAEDLNRKRI